MTTLRFPAHERPDVTIVIPVYGQQDWCSRTLAAVIEHTARPYEVVIVDDASPDGSGEWLDVAVQGAAVHHNPRNVGFGATCNVGAALARGRCLVFLNSDALPQRGWLEPLVDAVAESGIGAAGPRILNLDGTLQQAGALVGGDGMTLFHGHDDDPEAPEYTFSRTVDYVSGACLAVRRTAFTAVGGFDAAFGRGYYEDVDLCLRLREAGLRTLYVPESTVTHAHRASGSEEDAAALSRANRATFALRRRAALAGRPPLGDAPRAHHAAREAATSGSVLVVAHDASPSAVDDLVARLAAEPGVRTTVIAPSAPSATDVELLPLERLEEVLAARAFVYDAAFVVGGDTTGVVQKTQPQAAVFELRTGSAVGALLADAGIVGR